jgi:hypothetical protein
MVKNLRQKNKIKIASLKPEQKKLREGRDGYAYGHVSPGPPPVPSFYAYRFPCCL